MNAPSLRLCKTREFLRWVDSLETIFQFRVHARLERVILGHLGESNSLGEGLFELKWKSGLRLYYSRHFAEDASGIVLWGGGFKGTQERDISRVRNLKVRYENELKDL